VAAVIEYHAFAKHAEKPKRTPSEACRHCGRSSIFDYERGVWPGKWRCMNPGCRKWQRESDDKG